MAARPGDTEREYVMSRMGHIFRLFQLDLAVACGYQRIGEPRKERRCHAAVDGSWCWLGCFAALVGSRPLLRPSIDDLPVGT